MIRSFGFSLLMLTIAGSFGMAFKADAQADAQQVGSLTVAVSELRNPEGNVCLKLFSGSEGFPNDDESALQITCVPIESTPATATPSTDPSDESPSAPESTAATAPSTVPSTAPSGEPTSESTSEPAHSPATPFRYTFEDLPYGNYAVAIYHDRNSNERLNRGLFGMPEEGYGFSNDAPASFGPADFADAVFDLETADTTIQIKMRYP